MRFGTLRLASTLLFVALASFGCADLLGGLGGNQGTDDGTTTPPDGTPTVTTATDIAGIHGFGSVVENADGLVSARLEVVTLGAAPRYLSGIANPTLTHNGETIPLLTGSAVGVFVTSSSLAPSLTYEAGSLYMFAFEVADEEGILYSYSASVLAPDGPRVIAEAAPVPIRYAAQPIEMTLINASEAVAIQVVTGGGITYDTTAVNSLAEVPLVLGLMEDSVGPVVEIPATAFPTPGSYRIGVTSMNVATPSEGGFAPGLGLASWFGVGTADTLILDVQ